MGMLGAFYDLRFAILQIIYQLLPYLFTASCVDGDIQLVDGETEWKGSLEICFNQRWGTVSGEGWDSTETEVVCRELGYQSTGMYCGVKDLNNSFNTVE